MRTTNPDEQADLTVSDIAAAIGKPARARILYRLADGYARTSTELSIVANVSPSTTSVHLDRLKSAHLINVTVQGKHRFYRLAGHDVARALEGLSVLAGMRRENIMRNTPKGLHAARTCYDHLAGTLGVRLHDRLRALKWLKGECSNKQSAYELSVEGNRALRSVGVQVELLLTSRRRFAYPCLDWSERRPHLGGALGAALLELALKREWVIQDLDTRALDVTSLGRREMANRFGLQI